MPKRRYLVVTDKQRDALIAARDHDPHPSVRERCAALLRIAAGESPHAVARSGVLKPRKPDTIYDWMDYYEAEGLDGLRGHQQGGSNGGRLQRRGRSDHRRPGTARTG